MVTTLETEDGPTVPLSTEEIRRHLATRRWQQAEASANLATTTEADAVDLMGNGGSCGAGTGPKVLKLKKFKGLDDTMPVTMWLKTVRAEVMRQAVSLGAEWQERQLYHEVASNLEGEAQR
ncbi:Retrovirus Polyprotein [Phytophthora cinnamomi]|uniref:Retrovirus Polyprotein n=1 Tax=Phytophthora cinnamomi TaxID=4785 RepID=UPI003559D5BC|nr:Retrovirus Polyprotein [Phytophthora cinnamomi]